VKRYLLLRSLQSIPGLVLLAVVSFGLLRLAPGDPALVLLGPLEATPEAIGAIRREYGLDQPFAVQFGVWALKVVQGDLGRSIFARAPVREMIVERLPVTLELAAAALLLAVLLGLPLGVAAALRPGGAIDSLGRLFSLVGVSVPSFVVGIGLIMLFGWYLPGILPYDQWVPISDLPGNLSHLLLPAVTLSLVPMAIVARLSRSSMLDVLGREYITIATAFGVQRREVIWLDALKNALLPVVSVLGVIAAHLVGGTVIVETIFNLPGLGRLLYDGLLNRDYPVASGDLLVISVMVVLVNLAVDILYALLNPRIARAYAGRS
jgi:peptide/nickel transport system permease protein